MQTFQTIKATAIQSVHNDRKHFDQEKLTDLAWSIKESAVAPPITVRPVDGHFVIVAGERRFRAMTEVLGYDAIPCLVCEMNEEEAARVMLAENTARVNLNPIEEAHAFQARIEQFGWSVERVADVAGVSKDIVKKRLALLALREEIQHLLKYDGLPLGHAEAVCALDRNRQLSALRILQQSKTPMPLAAFKDVCAELLAEQNQDNLFGLELLFIEQVKKGAGDWNGGAKAVIHFPVRHDLPAVVTQREKGVTAAHAIEDYIATLQHAGLDAEAATIGTLYAGLLKANLMKPRTRMQ